MSKFSYTARDTAGNMVSSVVEAESRYGAIAALRDQDLTVGVDQVEGSGNPSEFDRCSGIALQAIEDRRLPGGSRNAADVFGLAQPRLPDYENVVAIIASNQRSNDSTCGLRDRKRVEVE